MFHLQKKEYVEKFMSQATFITRYFNDQVSDQYWLIVESGLDGELFSTPLYVLLYAYKIIRIWGELKKSKGGNLVSWIWNSFRVFKMFISRKK